MTSNKTLLYIGETRGTHDDRFINAFKLIFDVTEVFNSDHSTGSKPVSREFDIVVVSPISIQLLQFSKDFKGIKIGICWAIEVNEVSYSEPEILLIQDALHDFMAVVVDADYIVIQIQNRFLYNGKIIKLYFGCDLALFSHSRNFNSIKIQNRICVTRKWLPLYNNELIIQALSRIESAESAKVSFVSDCPALNDSINTLIATSKIEFTFLGVQSAAELVKVYLGSDIYLSASRSDGISVSLLEAMASGLICIVTDFPSNLEIITHGENGFVFKNGDLNSLLRTVKQVFSLSVEERLEIIQRAQKFTVESANWNKNKWKLINSILEIPNAG